MAYLTSQKKNDAKKLLVNHVSCSDYEAEELLSSALDVADQFEKLPRNYKTDYLADTEAHIQKIQDHNQKDKLGKFISSPPSAPYSVSSMWRSFKAAESKLSLFRNSCSAHHIADMNGRLVNSDRVLTVCFECLNEVNAFGTSTKVADGRRIYDTLQSKTHLMEQIVL